MTNSKREQLGILLCTLLTAILAFFQLGSKGFSWAETFTIFFDRDWDKMLDIMAHSEGNMWLYHLLEHFVLKLGDNEFIVRSLSAFWTVITVPVFYLLSKRLLGCRTGFVATLLLIGNVFFIRYSQEARAYSQLLFASVLSTYIFVCGIEKPRWGIWLCYALSILMAIYSHLLGALIVPAHIATLFFLPTRDVPFKKIAGSFLLVGIGLSPLFIARLSREQIGWMHQVESDRLVEVLLRFTGYSRYLTPLYCVLFVVGLLALYRSRASLVRSRDLWKTAFVPVWAIVPIALAYGFSVWVQPILGPKYLMVSFAPWIILAGVGLASIKGRLFPAIMLIALTLSGLRLQTYYKTEKKQDWKEATTHVLSNAKEGDAVLFFTYGRRIAYEYYVDHLPSNWVRPTLLELSSGPYPPAGYGPAPDPNWELLEKLKESYPRVWIVYSYDSESPYGREAVAQRIQSTLRRHYPTFDEKEFLEIRVRLYQ